MHTSSSSSSSLLSSIIATNRSHSRARAGLKTSISMAFAVGACLLMSGVASAQTPTPLPVTVSLPIDTLDTSVPPATVVPKPVSTTDIQTSFDLVGFQGDFTFNETIVSFASPPVQNSGLTGGNWNVSGNVLPGPGPIRTLRVSAFSNDFTPLSGTGTLYLLRMLRVSSTPGASTPLTWAAPPDNFFFIDSNLKTHTPTGTNGLITITGPSPSGTPSPTPTSTATATATATVSATPTNTATATATASATGTASATATATATIPPSATPTTTPSVTPSATTTPTVTATPTISATPVASATPTVTITPSATPTSTPSASPSGTPFATPTPTFQGNFVIGDQNAVVGNHVYFWGSQWAQNNTTSGGSPPNSFKGFAGSTSPNPADCGGTWTARPGNSGVPPNSLPQFITVIATSSVTQSGSTISGDVALLVVVETDPGYQPNPGHPGTGTVVSVTCMSASAADTISNISTRIRVGTEDNVLIGGLIVTGTSAKKVLVRAIGPSLPLADRLADPVLELHDSSGQIIAVNDNWVDSPNRQAIIETTIPPSNNLESAILMSLQPGAYTATVRGINHTTGIALVEAYDLDRVSNSRLANISTRGLVQTNDDVLIAGMIVAGQTPQRVIVRATGPSLEVPGKLANPILELRDGDGNLIRSNDNWRSDQEAEITSTTIAPTNDLESAIVATLPANGTSYTAIVRGADGGTGVSVIEVYGLNN